MLADEHTSISQSINGMFWSGDPTDIHACRETRTHKYRVIHTLHNTSSYLLIKTLCNYNLQFSLSLWSNDAFSG